MSRAIGMIEFKTTPAGITAADAMVKTSEVEIVEAQTVCPGKYHRRFKRSESCCRHSSNNIRG